MSCVLLMRRLKSIRERLVSSSRMTVHFGDQLVTPETTIGLLILVVVLCPIPVSSLGCPCLPAVTTYGTVNRGSEFAHKRLGPEGYHNKMRQLDPTCDSRLMAVLTSLTHVFT